MTRLAGVVVVDVADRERQDADARKSSLSSDLSEQWKTSCASGICRPRFIPKRVQETKSDVKGPTFDPSGANMGHPAP